MNKKLITTIIILTSLVFIPITTKADYPTGTLRYSDDIVIGSEFVWTVKQLVFEGDFAPYTYLATVGGEELSKGDKIKFVITDDPDTAIGDWFEIYLGSDLLPSATFGAFLSMGLAYAYGGFFINPVTYTNVTGTYNIYEQILEELEDNNEDNSYTYSDETSEYTYTYSYTEKIEISLQGDVFVIKYQIGYSLSLIGPTTEISESIMNIIETTTNIRTGLLGKMDVLTDIYSAHTGSTVDGKMHILVDSGYAKTPYDWAFSFLGLTIIAVVVGISKRRR